VGEVYMDFYLILTIALVENNASTVIS